MEFGFSQEEEAFRHEVRAFLAEVATPEVIAEADSGQGWGPHTWKFVQALGTRKWLTPTWPKEYGGLGLPPIYRFIIHEEIDFTGALKPEALMVGANIAGPTIIAYGSDKQKRDYLPRIARGEIELAIGYTEPQAGSDLGSLQMRAEDKGDHFVFNGQKVFNTRCHFAQYHWIVARTDPAAPKHRGISLFIVDMKTPGITVRPLYGLDGIRTNEVYYDNVVVPREGLVGEQNKGFGYTMSALEFERVLTVGTLTRNFRHLVNYVKSQPALRQDSLVRQKIGQIAAEIEITRLYSYRMACMQTRRVATTYEASASKLFTSELSQRMAGWGMEILGLSGQLQHGSKGAPMDGVIEHLSRETLLNTIAGGTSEVMRNTIATRGLGLPR